MCRIDFRKSWVKYGEVEDKLEVVPDKSERSRVRMTVGRVPTGTENKE